MVAKGLGIAFASERMALTVSQSVCYVPISNPYTPWVTRLYWRKNQSFTPDEQLFKDFVEQYYTR
jgi:DNA-binding transcriptional LysR family regulator